MVKRTKWINLYWKYLNAFGRCSYPKLFAAHLKYTCISMCRLLAVTKLLLIAMQQLLLTFSSYRRTERHFIYLWPTTCTPVQTFLHRLFLFGKRITTQHWFVFHCDFFINLVLLFLFQWTSTWFIPTISQSLAVMGRYEIFRNNSLWHTVKLRSLIA